MKKWMIIFLFICLLTGCQTTNKPSTLSQKDELDIVVATDLHYFDPDLYDECDWFEEAMLYGDGKMVADGDEIIDTFIDTMILRQPDLVILTGDLTFNGELFSHQKLSEKLLRLKEKNIPVALIPGNHDLNNFFTKGYGADSYFQCDSTTLADFKKIYAGLDLNLGYQKHDASASYVLSLNDTYELILLDDGISSTINEETKEWLTNQLVLIKNKQKIPLIAMHHNLAIHNENLYSGFTITNNEEYAQLFHNYEVPFVLSGHIHCQHIQSIHGVYDIVTSSLLNAPLQYGNIHLTTNKMHYKNESLQISKDPNAFFDQTTYNTFYEQTEFITDELERSQVLETIQKANRYYFAGQIYDYRDELIQSAGYPLIQKYQEKFPFVYRYIENMLTDTTNHNELTLQY